MRVLLINANRFKQPWPVIPFGLCCVAASCEKAGHQVQVLDLCFSKNCFKDIFNSVNEFKPDTIGISIRNIDKSSIFDSLFLLTETNNEVILPCKQAFDGPIVIGGPSVGINGAQMLDFFDLEYAIVGDGEAAMPEFLKRLEGKLPFDGLKGLVIRRNGKTIQNPPPFFVENLDSLPLARPYKYLNIQIYRRYDSPLLIQTKRGCELKCAYCTYNHIEGLRYRLRNPGLIVNEIEDLVGATAINHIEFTDSVFNIPLGHAKAVLRAIIAKKLKLRLRTLGVNPGAVDEELADLMKQAGFRDIDLGVDSASDTILESLAKNYRQTDVLRAGKIFRKRNIPINWYLLLGAPGETPETIRETLRVVSAAASSWDIVTISAGIRVYNGSPIADRMKEANPNCTDDDFLRPIGFVPESVSLEDIKLISKHESLHHANFYLNYEDEVTPPPIFRFGVALFRLFHLEQPMWRWFIILRKIETLLGIRQLKGWLWKMKHKKVSDRLIARCC